MKSRALLAGTVATAIGVFALPATATADSVKIGSALQHPNSPSVCDSCAGVQLAQAGGSGALPLRSPTDGTVTSWSVRTGDVGAIYRLLILRPTGGNTFTNVAGNTAPPVPGATVDSILSHSTSLPIRRGDAIGVAVPPPTTGLPKFTGDNTADTLGYSLGVPSDGASLTFIPLTKIELLIQATVKYCKVPSVKGMKIKAAKLALTAADCTPKVKKKEARKKKNRAKVLKQKKQPGTTAAPGTIVTILVGKKPKA